MDRQEDGRIEPCRCGGPANARARIPRPLIKHYLHTSLICAETLITQGKIALHPDPGRNEFRDFAWSDELDEVGGGMV
jgi:hypothetical protein